MGFHDFQGMGGAVLPGADRADAPALMHWSDASVWAGRPPRRNDVVHVPAGRTLLVDQDVDVACLLVNGEVEFAARDLRVCTGGLLATAGGVVRAGTRERPHLHRLTLTLREAPAAFDGLGTKFVAALDGGAIELFGPRRVSWTVLADTVFPGGVLLKLAEAVDWRVGERLVVASGGTDLPLVEERMIAAVSGDRRRVTLDRPLAHRHLGRSAPVFGALEGTIGKVALLSRDLVVEGDAGSDRTNCGAHCLIAPAAGGDELGGRASQAHFVGVEFRRVGQFNQPGRYPLHWQDNGGATSSTVLDCVVHQSYQRGVVVLGSQGVRLQGNVVYRPLGHGYIVEQAGGDATLVTSNLAIRPRVVRFADPAMRLMCEHRPRAIWFAQATRPRTFGRVLR
ncbi:MAG TPA: G8 domain-containing protein [Burkholderiaceae bacterium]|nr:G8 domain-containing protein [Burkholderiaceae bacterium]